MKTTRDISQMKAALRAAFSREMGYRGFELEDGVLRIFIRDEAARLNFPETFEGMKVELVVVGDAVFQQEDSGS